MVLASVVSLPNLYSKQRHQTVGIMQFASHHANLAWWTQRQGTYFECTSHNPLVDVSTACVTEQALQCWSRLCLPFKVAPFNHTLPHTRQQLSSMHMRCSWLTGIRTAPLPLPLAWCTRGCYRYEGDRGRWCTAACFTCTRSPAALAPPCRCLCS